MQFPSPRAHEVRLAGAWGAHPMVARRRASNRDGVPVQTEELRDDPPCLPDLYARIGRAPSGARAGEQRGLPGVQQAGFADGALPEKTKQLIAVAVAHVTQCPYCIHSHTRIAVRKGATEREIMEAIWVAAEMRAGGAYAHSVIALDAAGSGHGGH